LSCGLAGSHLWDAGSFPVSPVVGA
jgi:hypothetical protein